MDIYIHVVFNSLYLNEHRPSRKKAMPPCKIDTDKPLREQKELSAAIRGKMMKVDLEIKKMRQDWKNILNKEFSKNYTKRPAECINCDFYPDVRKNWDTIKKYLDKLRADRKDVPWPECLPSGILSCTLCTDYVKGWKAEYHRED